MASWKLNLVAHPDRAVVAVDQIREEPQQHSELGKAQVAAAKEALQCLVEEGAVGEDRELELSAAGFIRDDDEGEDFATITVCSRRR